MDPSMLTVRKEYRFWLDGVTDFPGKRDLALAFYLTVLFKVSRVQLRVFQLQLFHVDSAPGLVR